MAEQGLWPAVANRGPRAAACLLPEVLQNHPVHPGLLWVQTETTAVEEDCCFEILAVSEAANASFDGHDFAVHPLRYGVGDFVSAVTHNIPETLLDGFCHGLHWLEFCVNHSPVPVIEECGRRRSSVLPPKIMEHFLVRPGLSGLELPTVCRIEERLLLLREILQARQPDVLRRLDIRGTHIHSDCFD